MTEQQVKGMIVAMCNWMFGKGCWRIFVNDDRDFILIETDKAGKFIGEIPDVYCQLERLFFSGCYKKVTN